MRMGNEYRGEFQDCNCSIMATALAGADVSDLDATGVGPGLVEYPVAAGTGVLWIADAGGAGVALGGTGSVAAAFRTTGGQLSGRSDAAPGPQPFRETVLMLELWRDVWAFLRERKKFWLMPIIVVLALLGGLLIFAENSVMVPLIYTLF